MRTVHQPGGKALTYVGHPEDTGAGDRLQALIRSLAKMVAAAAAADLGEPSRFPVAETRPVQVHVFAPEPEESGPSAEVLIDQRGAKPWAMEVAFDGLNISRYAAHWIVVDVLVSAADRLEAGRTGG